MAADIKSELISYLGAVYAIERQRVRLLSRGIELAGDEQIAEIYRGHCRQTEEHASAIAERLAAQGGDPVGTAEAAPGVRAPEIRFAGDGTQATPATLAMAAYAFGNLEIAAYHLLRGVAERAGDDEDTVAAAERILEQEEATTELVASTFDRALELSLGELPRSPTGHFGGGRSSGDRDPHARLARGGWCARPGTRASTRETLASTPDEKHSTER